MGFFRINNSINFLCFKGKNYLNNNLVETVDKLKNKFNCTVEISTDEKNNLNGIFIQDSFMTESFEAYPAVIF